MMEPTTPEAEIQAFLNGRTPAGGFDHREHVRLAHAIIVRHGFEGGLPLYIAGLRAVTRAAGVPEKFNLTVTVAFMALIAERAAATPNLPWSDFAAAYPDLLSGDILKRWYDPTRLGSTLARQTFLLPDPANAPRVA